jgi:CRP-like cAMP-binding protein
MAMDSMSKPGDRPINRLLGQLSQLDYERLRPHLHSDVMDYKKPLYSANEPIDFVWFIETGVASLVNTMCNGDAAEVGTIGNEGMVGLPLLLDALTAPTSVYVQVPGTALRMNAKQFSIELAQSSSLRRTMHRYAHAFFNQVAQSAACVHFHNIMQRCCRWLLMTHDRMQTDEFLLTQEFLAMMLGVHRPGVSIAAGELQKAGFIHYKRGIVTIRDRQGLEANSCECYDVSRREFNCLLDQSPSDGPGKRSDPANWPTKSGDSQVR